MQPSPKIAVASAAAADEAVVDAYNAAIAKTNSVYGAMSAAEAVFRRQQRPAQDRVTVASTVALIVSRATHGDERAAGSRKRAK